MNVFFPVAFSNDGAFVQIAKAEGASLQHGQPKVLGSIWAPPEKAKFYNANCGGSFDEVWM